MGIDPRVGMVEAAGIEPASESQSPGSPTGVSGRLNLVRARSDRRDQSRTSPRLRLVLGRRAELRTSLRFSDARSGPHRRGPGSRRRYLSGESQLLIGS